MDIASGSMQIISINPNNRLGKILKFNTYNHWRPVLRVQILTLFLSILVAIPSQAQEQLVTFPEAVKLFTENNLDLLLSRSSSKEWAALARQASAYPNPTFLVSHEPVYRDDESSSETYFNLSQPIEWPGFRRARIDAAKRLAHSAKARFHADSLQLIFELAKTYIEASGAEQQYQNVLLVNSVFQEADRDAEAQYESGEMSGYHLRRLRIERARYENRLAIAELELHRLQRRLAMLIMPENKNMRIVPASKLAPAPTLLTLEVMQKQAQANRAELVSAIAEAEAAGFSLASAKKEIMPSPIITAGYKRQSDRFGGLFLGTALDIPIFDRNRGSIDAKFSRLFQAETRLILVQQQIEQDVNQAHETYTSLSKRTTLISENLLGESAQLLHSAQTSYAEGEMTLIELLDASDAFFDARSTTTKLMSHSLVAYYDLMRASGHIPLN